MNVQATAAVAWQHERTSLRAVWARESESVEWIAASTQAFATGLTELLDIPQWFDTDRQPWPSDEENQRHFVRNCPVVHEDRAIIGGGYSIWLYGPRPPSPSFNVDAGGVGVGGRIPLHSAGLSFNPQFTSTPPPAVVNDIVALAVRAWQPLTVLYSTAAVSAASGRRNWNVPAGYRVWISPEVGTVTQVADGVTAHPLEGGTLLSAPDGWEAVAVAEAMNATLDANGLDEIPHPAD